MSGCFANCVRLRQVAVCVCMCVCVCVCAWRCVVLCDISFVNQSHIINQNPLVTAINCCIEVDLTRQVCADSIGTRMFSSESICMSVCVYLCMCVCVFVVMCDISFVNSAHIINQNPRVTAINSCIEVDLTGQVCADSIGTRLYSGICLSLSISLYLLHVC